MEFNLQQLGLEAGGGAVIGGIIGFAAKKLAKILAFLVGLQLALFKFLETQDILTVDWERLSAGLINVSTAASAEQPPDVLTSLLSAVPVSAGFAGGFFVGFKKG